MIEPANETIKHFRSFKLSCPSEEVCVCVREREGGDGCSTLLACSCLMTWIMASSLAIILDPFPAAAVLSSDMCAHTHSIVKGGHHFIHFLVFSCFAFPHPHTILPLWWHVRVIPIGSCWLHSFLFLGLNSFPRIVDHQPLRVGLFPSPTREVVINTLPC